MIVHQMTVETILNFRTRAIVSETLVFAHTIPIGTPGVIHVFATVGHKFCGGPAPTAAGRAQNPAICLQCTFCHGKLWALMHYLIFLRALRAPIVYI